MNDLGSKIYGLYIHIPFCKSKCYYCDFYSEKYEDTLLNRYIESLNKEVLSFVKKLNFPKISTLYIGGGTPSLLKEQQIIKLFDIIKKNFETKFSEEITIELNPESVDENKIKILKDIVITEFIKADLRLSLGVQSFNDEILKNIGRIHTSKQVYNAVEIFNKLNITNYNFDLIFGCPGQTLEDIEKDLINSINLYPTHISCYALTIEENTFLYNQGYHPDEDLQAEMYNLIVEFLNDNKYIQYEISNFAKDGFWCKHNLNYWLYKEYIGLGPSSVSFFDSKRIKNISSVKEYLEDKFLYEKEIIDEETMVKEKIMLSLRTNLGLYMDEKVLGKYKVIIDKLIKEKKLFLENNFIKIPIQYRFLSNLIISEFM
jgi:oxygen-independent coproporphyrinogen-3 oxidase